MDYGAFKQELTRDEGYKRRLYYDSLGIPTIGIGRNLRDRNLSDDEIDLLVQNDMRAVVRQCQAAVGCWVGLDGIRQRVVANMTFNVGIARFLGFKRTLQALERGEYERAATEMLDSAWARQVGLRADRLATMMRTGLPVG